MARIIGHSLGWVPDLPDWRDYSAQNKDILEITNKLSLADPKAGESSTIDLREWCSPIQNQEHLNSCTAHAASGIIEYFQKRAHGKYIPCSRLFIYKVTRNLLHWKGDIGANVRTTMGALALFGVPPEEYLPYTTQAPDFDDEPAAFCYSFARGYLALKYFRHDPPVTVDKTSVVKSLKTHLALGIPAMFGFTVYNSIQHSMKTGLISMPAKTDGIEGGHAVALMGFDDSKVIINSDGDLKTVGAFLIRNSWGAEWGEDGYGWIPYDYFLKGLAKDCWSMIQAAWIDTESFSR